MKAYITVGLPASGKSTWARNKVRELGIPEFRIVNNDSIRNEIYEERGNREWNKDVENTVRRLREGMITAFSKVEWDIIVDNTHMNRNTLDKTVELCKSLGYEVELVDFTMVPVNECIRRDSLRTGHERVGEEVIRKMWKKYKEGRERRPLPNFKPNKLPECIICDLDGTLFDPKDRNPYDESKVLSDDVRLHVLSTITALTHRYGFMVFFFTGRSENCISDTKKALDLTCGFSTLNYTLVMRGKEDKRRDSEVKREMYETHIKDKYNVFAVFDDRPQVIRECWQPLNLPVFNCGLIDVEF